jgi:hypothetical protein
MANRYWVGGTGNWDTSSTKWAATDGGASTQTFATGDTVFITSKNAPNWTSLTALSSGAIRSPTTGNGYYYEVTTAGTTGATEPTWPTPEGTTVTDGTVVWTCRLATVTLSTSVSALTFNMLGFAGTLAFGTNTISVSGTGSVFISGTTYSVTGTPLILLTNATATARTLSTGSTITEAQSISFNISAGGSTFSSGSGNVVRDLIFSGSFAGSFSNTGTIIYGNLTFKSGMTITAGTNTVYFYGTGAVGNSIQKITSATLNLNFPINFFGTSTYQLQDALSVGTTTSRQITLSSGTLDLNGFVLTNFGIFSSTTSSVRSIAFNGGNYTNTLNTTTTVVNISNAANFTYTGTPIFNITGNTTSITTTVSITNSTETNALNINVSSGVGTVALTGIFKNINLTGFTGTLSNTARTIYGNLIIPSGITALTAGTSATTFAATSGIQQITSGTKNLNFPITFSGTATYQLQDALAVGIATSRTITLTSGTLDLNNFTLTHYGLFSSSNTNTRSIVFGSTGSIVNTLLTGTAWSMADLTNFSFTGTSNVQFTSINGAFTVSHGTTNGSEAQALSFAFGSNPTTLTLGASWILDLTLLSNFASSTSPTFSPTTLSIYGSYLDQSTQSFTAPVALNLVATLKTTNYITVTSNIPPTTVTVNAGSGVTYKLLTQAFFSTLNIQSSFDSNSIDFYAQSSFNVSGSNTKTLTLNSILTIFSGSFTDSSSSTTYNLTGSTIRYSNTGTFNAPNGTFPYVFLDGSLSNTTLTIGGSGSNPTITTLAITSGSNKRIIAIYAGSTLNVTNLSIDGTATATNNLQSTIAGTQATISKPSGTILTNYLTIKDSAATGGAVWTAPTTNGNINNGNNTGWIFGTAVQKLLTVLSSSTITLNKNTQKYLNIASNSTITLLTNRIINVILTVFSYISFGALNSFAINNNAINDASTTNGVISTNTITNNINKTFSYVSSVASSLTNSSAFLKLLSVVAASTNTILKTIQTTKTVVTSSTASVLKVVGKVVSYVSTSTNSLIPSRAYLRLLSVTSTSTATMFKLVGKTIAALCVSVVLFIKVVGKKATVSVSSTATLLYGFFFNKILSVSVSTTNTVSKLLTLTKTILATVASTATIQKAKAKILLAISTTSSFVTTVTARFVLLVTTVYTSVVSHFYKVLLNIEDTIIVPTKKVIVQVFVGFTDILVKPKKTNIVVTKQDDVNG